jgi:Ni,Fe-hydrogenase III component G
MKTEKSEERMKTLSLKEIEAQLWMKRNNLNTELNNEIKENIKRLKWEEIKDANMDNLFSIFSMQPLETQKSLKYFLCMQTLIKVSMLLNLS